MKGAVKRGFTLVEMLVVIGIIGILMAASLAAFTKMTKSAEKARAQELVSNVATALTALFQQEGCWPPRLLNQGKTDGRLDENAALALAKGGYFSMSTDNPGNPKHATKLTGHDRFGIVTPWATALIKRKGDSAKVGDKVDGVATINNHVLHYALDLDGDGIIKGASVGGESVNVRATAIVWCIGKSGGKNGDPWPYKEGLRKDDLYSWTLGQTKDVD